jgi:hypothetical protein
MTQEGRACLVLLLLAMLESGRDKLVPPKARITQRCHPEPAKTARDPIDSDASTRNHFDPPIGTAVRPIIF